MNRIKQMLGRIALVRKARLCLHAWRQDIHNVAHYGIAAPRFAERIWVDPMQLKSALVLPPGVRRHHASGLVMDTSELQEVPLFGSRQFDSSIEHWCRGVPWEETADYLAVMEGVRRGERRADCNTEKDVLLRYQRLDALIETVREEGRLRTRPELEKHAFREYGGVQVCVGKQGRLLLLQHSGYHRFAIAWILNLPLMPAQIGLVDPDAIQYLRLLREPALKPGERAK